MKNKLVPKKTAIAMILIIAALLSMFVLSGIASSPKVHSTTINSLNEKQNTVLSITAAAATSATAISLIPGDTTTAIANKVLDVSSYLFLVVCVIFLEKILLTVFGYVSFSFIIPVAFVLLLIYLYNQKKVLKVIAIKLIVLAVALSMIIPLSVKISTLIEDANKETIEYATQATGKIENTDEKQENDKNWLEKAVDKIGSASKNAIEEAKNILSRFVNSVAMLMVTSILIPILVVLALSGVIKILFGVQIHMPDRKQMKLKDKENEFELIEEQQEIK